MFISYCPIVAGKFKIRQNKINDPCNRTITMIINVYNINFFVHL